MDLGKRSPSNGDGFASHLYRSFRAARGDIFAILGLALSVITFFVVPDQASLRLRFAIVPILLGTFLIFWLFHAAWTGFSNKIVILPSVRYAFPPPETFPSAITLLLLEPSVFYSYDAVVSIYFVENEFEKLIGVGRVINVQEDRKIQVLVTDDINFGDKWATVLNNDVSTLPKLRVKPSIPSFIMEMYRNEHGSQ